MQPLPHRPEAASPDKPGSEGDHPADVEVLEAAGIQWVALAGVGADEVAWVRQHHSFHPLAMEDLTSRNQRPKVDDYGRELFIVLYFPLLDTSTGSLRTVEVDIFVSRDFIVSVPRAGIPGIEDLFERYRSMEDARLEDFRRGTGYLVYRIIDAAIDNGFPILKGIGDALERIEDSVFDASSDATVRAIAAAKTNIIDFRRLARPQRATYRQLKRAFRERDGSPELDPYFDDAIDASERTWDLLEAYVEVVTGLETTNQNIRGARVNNTVRILTAWSVVILPLTLVASIFGMNVRVPGEGEIVAFWIIVLGMAVGLVLTVRYFRRRDWL